MGIKTGDRVRHKASMEDGYSRVVNFHDRESGKVRKILRSENIHGPLHGVVIAGPAGLFYDAHEPQIDVFIEGQCADGLIAGGWDEKSWELAPEYEPSDETKLAFVKWMMVS